MVSGFFRFFDGIIGRGYIYNPTAKSGASGDVLKADHVNYSSTQ